MTRINKTGRTRHNFTEREDEFIKTNYLSMQYQEIADALGLSIGSINHRINNLGLIKKSLRRWAKEEDEIIKSELGSGTYALAERLNRHPSEVSTRANKLGIPFRTRTKYINKEGYEYVRYTDDTGKRRELWTHIEVVEKELGRKLIKPELVHHINTIKMDNRIENLYLCRNVSEHSLIHQSVESLLPELMELGVVVFDKQKGKYEVSQKCIPSEELTNG